MRKFSRSLYIFKQGLLKEYFGNLLGIPWSTCVPIFINLGYSGAISIGGALYAPPVAAKEFYMPYWIGLIHAASEEFRCHIQ